jgi:primosomal protein N' (replication factor Y)
MSGFSSAAGGETLFGAENPRRTPAFFVRVAVERGIAGEGPDVGLTYACDFPDLAVGERVIVPLGRGDKPAGGTVIEVGGSELAQGLKGPPKFVRERTGARLGEDLLSLAKWMAAYYVCPLGMVLSGMTPAAVKKATGRKTETLVAPAPTAPAADALPRAAQKLVAALAAVPAEAFPMTAKALASHLGAKSVAPVGRMVKLGLLLSSEREIVEARGFDVGAEFDREQRLVTPTGAQAEIVDGICAALGSFAVNLLRGVTGSGKTEVYLRIIERVLAGGGGAIVLVPEIALTPQTSSRFLSRFTEHGVAVLHSGLSASQRHRAWDRVSRGAARVVVGARSAIFAPVAGLGIVVVDEEHDSSYKQDQLPRYHARDVAIKRAQIAACPVLLGSATPSLESWWNANGGPGRFRRWELPERVTGLGLPPVKVVDIREERKLRAKAEPSSVHRLLALGPTLEQALVNTVQEGGQAILLLNRRGFAHYITCPDPKCGWVMQCDDCDATMVLHRDRSLPAGGDVACHHCLARKILPHACPNCSRKLNAFGLGTQRLEEQLSELLITRCGLTEDQFARVDSDSMGGAADYFDVLGRFGKGELRVLLGTQMLAKGLDFPEVRLVGVVDADTSLNLPDFRSMERTFQLVSQVAGRAGRGEHRGIVIVQTMNPGSPAITHAAAHDFVGFARFELAIRTRSGLPPITRMARVVTRDESSEKSQRRAADIARAIRDAEEPGVSVRGPAECPIARTHGQYRFAVEITAPGAGAVQRALGAARAAGLLMSDARTAVDVDPVVLL